MGHPINKTSQAREAEKARLKEIARKATGRAPPESARLIVTLGQERLKAMQAAGIALDARTTQVAAFQLAAAAFAAGLSGHEQTGLLAASASAVGCLLFVGGSGLAFWGMRSCKSQVAGVEVSFWKGALDERLTDKLARCWAAEITEDFTFEARHVDEVRAKWLNRSLLVGGAGALAVLFAVGFNLFDKWNGAATTAPADSPGCSGCVTIRGDG